MQSVYSVPVLGPASNASNRSNASNANSTNHETIGLLSQFLSEFSDGDAFPYRDRLRANLLKKEWTLQVEMSDLIAWNEQLAARCRTEPGEIVPLVSAAACSPTRRRQNASGEADSEG